MKMLAIFVKRLKILCLDLIWGFPKLGVPLLGGPIIRIIVCEVYMGSPYSE